MFFSLWKWWNTTLMWIYWSYKSNIDDDGITHSVISHANFMVWIIMGIKIEANICELLIINLRVNYVCLIILMVSIPCFLFLIYLNNLIENSFTKISCIIIILIIWWIPKTSSALDSVRKLQVHRVSGEYNSNNKIPLRQSQTISGFVTSLLLFFCALYTFLPCGAFFFKTRLGMLINGISAFSLFLPFFLS